MSPKVPDFARLLRPHGNRVVALIFEFGTFNASTLPTPDDFLALLDPFQASLPERFRYAMEIRTLECLIPDYPYLLASRSVAHVFNAWTHMPAFEEHTQPPDALTVVPALLKRDRAYDPAVKTFDLYQLIPRLSVTRPSGLRHAPASPSSGPCRCRV